MRATRPASSGRALTVLDLLGDRGHPMGAMAIAQKCGIPRSSIYRLLNVMRSRDYLAYDRRDRSWSLGPQLFEIAGGSPTIAQALHVLETFDSATPRLTVADVARRAGIDLSVASRVADVLLAEGLLSAVGNGQLALGLRIVALAVRAEPIEHLVRTARPHLERLRDRTGETANLLVRDGASALYLDQAESPRALRVSGWIGRRIPLPGSASGAALTSGGVHVVSDAVERGVIAVACGIPGLRSVDAAVSITAPTTRLRTSALARAEAEVLDAADAIASAVAAGSHNGSPRSAQRDGSAATPQPAESAEGPAGSANRRRSLEEAHPGPETAS